MKQKFLTLIVILTANLANANSLKRNETVFLNDIRLDRQINARVSKASLALDYDSRTLTLDLYEEGYCQADEICPMYIHASKPLTYKVAISNVYQGNCGETIMEGIVDHRRVDGGLISIQLIDNRTMVCEMALKYLVQVKLRTQSSPVKIPTIETNSEFFGNVIQ